MQHRSFKISVFALSVFVLFSCKPKLDAPAVDAGKLDVSKYVAFGNSITSGYADGALYYDAQMVSYPNLLAQQFELIGGGEFKQPLMPMSSVGYGGAGNSRYALGLVTDCNNVTSLSPKTGPGDFNALGGIATEGPFNNMGMPGAKAITSIYPGYGNPANGLGKYNPFFTRILEVSEYGNASMLAKAAAQKPTFFSLFIGNNDVLSYALAGGAADSVTPSGGAPGTGFDATIDLIISTLSANGAKGVIANIPDITNLPYFTLVPYNGLLLDSAKAAALNAIPVYATVGLKFTPGNNPFLVHDKSLPAFFNIRKMKQGELVLLSTPQDSIKCFGLGSVAAFHNRHVLDEAEIAKIQGAIHSYNNKLKAVADEKGFAFVDVNAFMAKCKKGILYNGVTINTTFVSGGAFSLDGIHLTPIGNALLANEFIKAINSTYGSNIPQVEVTKYKGVTFP
ncbi:MAG: SGNH/GDSL hydrolase family protein [Bacteroidota bacterium]